MIRSIFIRSLSISFLLGAIFFTWVFDYPGLGGASYRQDPEMTLSKVRNWGYWLQGANVNILAASDFDLYVIDYSGDGTDPGAYTHSEIQQIRNANKIVVAYLSIGEVEDYRFYWQDWWAPGNPQFIGDENPNWPGNFKVKYWFGDWWDLALRPYLDRIISAGFDGVYLDIVDAYYYWGENGYDMTWCADEMCRLVQQIATYARKAAGSGFLIIPQNGLSIYDDASEAQRQQFLETIDGVGVESLFFNCESAWDQQYRLDLLEIYAGAGKRVLNVEYIGTDKYDRYIEEANKLSFEIITYAADPDQALDELNSEWLRYLTPSQISEKWDLWAERTYLRGANIYQRRVYPELDGADFMGPGPVGPPYDRADFDSLAAMGANYVNISHPGLFSETQPFILDGEIQASLDNLLEMIAQADMFAVISFRTGPGRSEFTFFWDEAGGWFDATYLNDSIWQDQGAQDAWVDMWQYTALRYGRNPIVVGFDLMVEANSNEVGSDALNDPLDTWDPEEFYASYGGTLYDWNQLYPSIISAIRQVDTDTPILIGGMGYSAVEWLPYLALTGDSRTVYAVHQYEPFLYTHQEPPLNNTYPGLFDTDSDGAKDQFDRTWLENLLSTVDLFKSTYNVPVAVNEFGVMRWEPGAAEFIEDQMGLFEGRGMNYALWLWETSWEAYSVEVDAFNFRHGPDPKNHSDISSSDLIEVIVQYWDRNTVRPSNVQFCTSLPVMNGSTSTYYDTLHAAYGAAGNGDTIKCQAINIDEDVNINRNIAVILSGGYDCNYATNPGNTTIKGPLTISHGSVTAEKIVLQ